MSVLLIVVVEDKEEERSNALEAIKRALVTPGATESRFEYEKGREQIAFGGERPVMVHFAPHFALAHERISFAKELGDKGMVISSVITDLMFPANKGEKEEPNGLGVLATCIRDSLPVVVCSDTDHHDVNYLKDVFPILGSAHPRGKIPVILDKKDWDKAVAELLKMLEADTQTQSDCV